ncbi:MAG: hypothetical protein IJ426_02410 [Clostridia bacterium]|nr:hypothetical protein [Clostridia bacterium]
MAKEKIKVNQVEAPTLFIGVGGTGCDIVKRVAEMCRPGETKNISFVCLDTNVNDLSNIQKSAAKIYYVQTSNTQTVGDYLAYDEGARRDWFPKNAVIYDKTVSEGAGQVRAISRLALNATIKTGKIRPLYDAIDDLFRKDGRELKQALRIVMVSTSSGGTGSGIILPLAMYVRDHVSAKYPNTSLIVRSLILLPETLDSVIDSSVERDSQRRNAYATIKEINAFMMKGSGFLDVEGDLKRYGNLKMEFPIPGTDDTKELGILPFDFCFLMDGQDAEDTTLVSISQYKQQAAQALYEQNIGPMQKNAFSVEDNIIKEMSNPGNYGRNRFGAIGASVVAYPYEKVADYVAYDWAINSIGGDGEAAKWLRYDKAYEIKRDDGRKKGLSESEIPGIEEVYVEKLNTSSDSFSKDMRSKYLGEAGEMRVQSFLAELKSHIMDSVYEQRDISDAKAGANALRGEIDFSNENTQAATSYLSSLRAFEEAVKKHARRVAVGAAEAVFRNDKKTVVNDAPYSLEFLLKNGSNEVAHPVAIRHLLYLVTKELKERVEEMSRKNTSATLDIYSEEGNPDKFNVKFGKSTYGSLEELCRAEVKEPSLADKLKGCEKIHERLNEMFPKYYKAITNHAEREALLAAYQIGLDYVEKLNKAFERFFATFKEKVSNLTRKKGDLVDELTFRKGDSTFNVCSTRELLDELSNFTKNQASEGALLDSEANGDIFDAIKRNVEFEIEIAALDVVEEDRRVDVFDDILVGYFKKDVRRKCSEVLDVNIIEAIALEQRLLARIKTRGENEEGEKVFDNATNEDKVRHILEVIAMGQRLAAPSVQRMRNVESREISLCAYNRSLDDMRKFRVKELMPKGNSVDSVSKYELRFFNALYNLTPDKLNKFAAARQMETTKRRSGLYHNAYIEYAKDIGPDSTKGSKISTHIDKRWDSIAVMPELDLDYQRAEMLKIHQAMIYGLVFDAIRHCKYSLTADDKMVYKYRNSDDIDVSLAVSNNTPCDEFYEIVDSLYISSFVVSDIDVIKAKKNYKDRMHHANYAETEFKKALDKFVIDEIREGFKIPEGEKSSLFEIPVYYYASLPNNKRFLGEISAIIDAVIKTFEDELLMWEEKDDVKFVLCKILDEQYNILMENYEKYPKLRNNYSAKDNPVIDTIIRKITAIVESTPEPSDYKSMIEKMKEKVK